MTTQETDLSYIHPPIDKALIKKELNQERFVRKTNKLDNEIYIINAQNAPNTLKEIGRLREITFASSGGGTGKELDLDSYDTSANCYQQLIVWSPEEEEIIGGYRYILCKDVLDTKPLELSTINYFDFSEDFKRLYLPYTIELGRSWIRPEYQPNQNPKKGLFALDNLWDGLGALVVRHQDEIRYLFGKVTMYKDYQAECRDALLYVMKYFFPDKDHLVEPKMSRGLTSNITQFKGALQNVSNFKEGYKFLKSFVRERKEMVPPLINSYMHLSDTMKTFGTASNPDFGNVEETGILLTIDDIHKHIFDRYTQSYREEKNR
ncbi:MAG: GNAT family N-acetyltransferase [Flavobacteriales bacterium]|jgi:hypothetical protein|nr:GNAT family N-acetyltransferase [Flavobacteriales bacterium]